MSTTHLTALVQAPGTPWFGWHCRSCTARQEPEFGVESRSAESAAQHHQQDPTWTVPPRRGGARL